MKTVEVMIKKSRVSVFILFYKHILSGFHIIESESELKKIEICQIQESALSWKCSISDPWIQNGESKISKFFNHYKFSKIENFTPRKWIVKISNARNYTSLKGLNQLNFVVFQIMKLLFVISEITFLFCMACVNSCKY